MRQKFALYLFPALSPAADSYAFILFSDMPHSLVEIISLHCSVKNKSSFDDLAEVAEDSSHYRKFDRTRKVH
ncbi:hypothetical protein B0H15DRAFT_833533, partial [Mycena belliarum]